MRWRRADAHIDNDSQLYEYTWYVVCLLRVVETEVSRLGRVRQGPVSDVRPDDSVHVQSVQVGHLSAETLFLDAFHRHRRQQVNDESVVFVVFRLSPITLQWRTQDFILGGINLTTF